MALLGVASSPTPPFLPAEHPQLLFPPPCEATSTRCRQLSLGLSGVITSHNALFSMGRSLKAVT